MKIIIWVKLTLVSGGGGCDCGGGADMSGLGGLNTIGRGPLGPLPGLGPIRPGAGLGLGPLGRGMPCPLRWLCSMMMCIMRPTATERDKKMF